MDSNVVQTWMEIIGTPTRAKAVLQQLWRLDGHKHRGCGGAVKRRVCEICAKPLARVAIRVDDPLPGPETIIFTPEQVDWMYQHPRLRAALDAWDQQFITKQDIKRFAETIARGKYSGPVLIVPDIAPRTYTEEAAA